MNTSTALSPAPWAKQKLADVLHMLRDNLLACAPGAASSSDAEKISHARDNFSLYRLYNLYSLSSYGSMMPNLRQELDFAARG